MEDASARADRNRFLIMAILFEGALVLLAVIGGMFLEHPFWTKINLTWESLGLGVIATLPLLGFLMFTYYTRIPQLVELRELTEKLIGPSLAACGWFELAVIALLAGVAEETLFRGTIEPWLAGYGVILSLVVCNLLFGFCHALTPTYFAFATAFGLYFSLTLRATDVPNLLIPICSHALYDFIAFVVIRQSIRKSDSQSSPDRTETAETPFTPDYPVFPDSR